MKYREIWISADFPNKLFFLYSLFLQNIKCIHAGDQPDIAAIVKPAVDRSSVIDMIHASFRPGFDRIRVIHLPNDHPYTGLIQHPQICNGIFAVIIHIVSFL